MRVLFIGDSITKGTVGVNWIKQLARKNPDWYTENAGVNGETITLIGERLLDKLEKDPDYNVVFLQAGTNDLLIPYFSQKNFLFKKAGDQLIRRGYNPVVDPELFEEKLWSVVIHAKKISRAKIILCTIASLGEFPDTVLNVYRKKINEAIRKVALHTGCVLADPATRFENYLQRRNTRDFVLGSFVSATWTDKWNCCLGNADQLSRERRLHLTIDGVHLNSKGAAIFKDEVGSMITILKQNLCLITKTELSYKKKV